MRVDQTGDDRLTRHVDDPGVRRYHYRTARPDSLYAVVSHDDVRVVDNLGANHGYHPRTPQNDHTLGKVPCGCDPDADLAGLVARRFAIVFTFFFGLALSRFDAVVERTGGVEIVGEVGVRKRPVDNATIAPPRGKLATYVGQLASRELSVRRFRNGDGRSLTTDDGNRDHVDMVVDEGEGLVSHRRHENHARVVRLGRPRRLCTSHLDVPFLVRAVPPNRNESILVVVQIDTIRVCREVRAGTTVQRRDHLCFTAVRRYPDEFGDCAGRSPRSG